ncbi:MAG: acyl carrier protein [Acidobacteriia bacterium]|nr:acyl carrier protein [Terriglobia bacterium]
MSRDNLLPEKPSAGRALVQTTRHSLRRHSRLRTRQHASASECKRGRAQIIDTDELRTTVIEVVNTNATPPGEPGVSLADDIRLANLGIDSLGVVLILLELSTRTGLRLERWEGMAPIRTVGEMVEFCRQVALDGSAGPQPSAVPQHTVTAEVPLGNDPVGPGSGMPN